MVIKVVEQKEAIIKSLALHMCAFYRVAIVIKITVKNGRSLIIFLLLLRDKLGSGLKLSLSRVFFFDSKCFPLFSRCVTPLLGRRGAHLNAPPQQGCSN